MISTADIVDDVASGLPKFLTTSEVAALLRITRRQVYRVVVAGRLRTLQSRPNSPLLIPRRSLLDYIETLAGG